MLRSDIDAKSGFMAIELFCSKAGEIESELASVVKESGNSALLRDFNQFRRLRARLGKTIRIMKMKRQYRPDERRMFVYAVVNKRNGYIKIGRSSYPYYREKTLQSEDPDVELLARREGSPKLERELHKKFAQFRRRGEWFALPKEMTAILLRELGTPSGVTE